ncbi:MAG TPA: molybdopterin-binding protein [Candidatus Limnocylindrales bacterium]
MDVSSEPNRDARRSGPLDTAVLLAIGSELTVGETRDTNGGDLARSLAHEGVDVLWISALPDRRETVESALRTALAAASLVVTTGGLGPTPDDLTREAIAAVCGEQPAVDPDLERWLHHMFERRGIALPPSNLKQAWVIPSATIIPNDHGTAPGWWVDRPDGRVIVALPGPPREMMLMWEGWVLPRLRSMGLGREHAARTYRLTGIGESSVADLLGEPFLRAANPVVATYARADAVDVRISARSDGSRPARDLVDAASAVVLAALGDHVWGSADDTWPAVLGRELSVRGWNVAIIEAGTGGSTVRLLGDAAWLRSASVLEDGGPALDVGLAELAARARRDAAATVGLAVWAHESGEDTKVEFAAAGPWGVSRDRQTAFLGGDEGRRRAGVAAAAFLLRALRAQPVLTDNTDGSDAAGPGSGSKP